MAVLALGEAEARAMLLGSCSRLEIAAINSRHSVTLAGDADAIAEFGTGAERRGIAWRALDLDFAFHSAAMEPIEQGLAAELGEIFSAAPVGELVSTVTGRHVAAGELDASHWWRNVREPVQFAAVLDRLVAD